MEELLPIRIMSPVYSLWYALLFIRPRTVPESFLEVSCPQTTLRAKEPQPIMKIGSPSFTPWCIRHRPIGDGPSGQWRPELTSFTSSLIIVLLTSLRPRRLKRSADRELWHRNKHCPLRTRHGVHGSPRPQLFPEMFPMLFCKLMHQRFHPSPLHLPA